ncbi:hypothetical protein [Vibrio phage vB_ValP_FGH]|nr:hypothetical protein [Vibrio phage vB_ValP_FGH]
MSDKDFLHRQLIKLGDMMGDGLHHEPDGKWIAKEYNRILKALGIAPPRKNNSEAINKAMTEAVEKSKCQKCGGNLRQTRSGSLRAVCESCGQRFQFKRKKRRAS